MSHPEFLRNASSIETVLTPEAFPHWEAEYSQEVGESLPTND
jgi:hypothetical protein